MRSFHGRLLFSASLAAVLVFTSVFFGLGWPTQETAVSYAGSGAVSPLSYPGREGDNGRVNYDFIAPVTHRVSVPSG